MEDIYFYGTMNYEPGPNGIQKIDPRLLRHCVLLFLPTPEGKELKSILSGTLEASMLFNEHSPIDTDLSNAIVEASMNLLTSVTNVLKACPTPGRQHYLFNMKTIITVLQVWNVTK